MLKSRRKWARQNVYRYSRRYLYHYGRQKLTALLDSRPSLPWFAKTGRRCDVSFKLLVCSGHHVSLRLLLLHLCNECPSLPKKKKKKKDWAKCNNDVRQVVGLCSSWLRGRDPSMTLESFQNLWCHNGVLASIRTVQSGTGEKLELICDLFASCPVALFW